MEVVRELQILLTANDTVEFERFLVKLKRCALVGHNFKMCVAMIHASYDTGMNIDDVITLVGKAGKKP